MTTTAAVTLITFLVLFVAAFPVCIALTRRAPSEADLVADLDSRIAALEERYDIR